MEKRPVVKEAKSRGKRVVRDLEQVGGEVAQGKGGLYGVEREGAVDVHTDAARGVTRPPAVRPPRWPLPTHLGPPDRRQAAEWTAVLQPTPRPAR